MNRERVKLNMLAEYLKEIMQRIHSGQELEEAMGHFLREKVMDLALVDLNGEDYTLGLLYDSLYDGFMVAKSTEYLGDTDVIVWQPLLRTRNLDKAYTIYLFTKASLADVGYGDKLDRELTERYTEDEEIEFMNPDWPDFDKENEADGELEEYLTRLYLAIAHEGEEDIDEVIESILTERMIFTSSQSPAPYIIGIIYDRLMEEYTIGFTSGAYDNPEDYVRVFRSGDFATIESIMLTLAQAYEGNIQTTLMYLKMKYKDDELVEILG